MRIKIKTLKQKKRCIHLKYLCFQQYLEANSTESIAKNILVLIGATVDLLTLPDMISMKKDEYFELDLFIICFFV